MEKMFDIETLLTVYMKMIAIADTLGASEKDTDTKRVMYAISLAKWQRKTIKLIADETKIERKEILDMVNAQSGSLANAPPPSALKHHILYISNSQDVSDVRKLHKKTISILNKHISSFSGAAGVMKSTDRATHVQSKFFIGINVIKNNVHDIDCIYNMWLRSNIDQMKCPCRSTSCIHHML